MIQLYAKKSELVVREKEFLTSGSAGACQVCFQFSEDWDGLAKTAVFRVGGLSWDAVLDEEGQCEIPQEALRNPGRLVYVGVYGFDGSAVALPTVWAYIGTVTEGAVPSGAGSNGDSQQFLAQLAGKADRLAYTGDGRLGLYAGNTLLSAVPLEGGGNGGTANHQLLANRDTADQHPISAITGLQAALDNAGTTDHQLLTNRNAADQHSIAAITGLQEALDNVPEAPEAITNEELEAILQ